MKKSLFLLPVLFMFFAAGHACASGEHRLGGGVTYWTAVDDVDFDDIDDDGFTYLASYQYWPSLLGVELDLEILPDKYGENAFAPQAYILFGKAILLVSGLV